MSKLARLGLFIPAGFIIKTQYSLEYFKSGGNDLPKRLMEDYTAAIHSLERVAGKQFGNDLIKYTKF